MTANPLMLSPSLKLERCPHCGVDTPNLSGASDLETADSDNRNKRCWRVYRCTRCGGLVTATAVGFNQDVKEYFPRLPDVDAALPPRAAAYLRQALNSLAQPAGAVMLAASAVDAMLKDKGYIDGSLYTRIDQAAKANLLTADMAKWAHQVRLDANDQRHADKDADLPIPEEAKQSVEFASALGQLLYVLPARVTRGIKASTQGTTGTPREGEPVR